MDLARLAFRVPTVSGNLHSAPYEKRKSLSPHLKRENFEIVLQRHPTPQGLFDEYVESFEILSVKQAGSEGKQRAEATLGKVRKQLTTQALLLIENCDRLEIVEIIDEIPYILYIMRDEESGRLTGKYRERLQHLEHNSRPRIAWVELLDTAGNAVPGTSWTAEDLPRARARR